MRASPPTGQATSTSPTATTRSGRSSSRPVPSPRSRARPTRRGAWTGPAPPPASTSPIGIATDGAGNLYVADTGNSTIRKIVIATRAVTTFAGVAGETGSVDGTGAAARFTGPNAIASDGAGNLYVGDGNGTIRKIAIASAAVSTVIGSPGRMGVSARRAAGVAQRSLRHRRPADGRARHRRHPRGRPS